MIAIGIPFLMMLTATIPLKYTRFHLHEIPAVY